MGDGTGHFRSMSIKIMNKVWDTHCETHTQKLILISLADNANDQGVCWPSIDYMALRCDLSRQAVINQIEHLTKLGFIKVRKSDGHVNVYEFLPFDAVPVNAVDPSTPLTPPVNAVDPHPSTPLTPPVNAVDPNRKEPPFEPSENRQGSSNPVQRRFKKPTLEQVKVAAKNIDLPTSEAEKFVLYYESNGWRVGKNPMKSWPHALQNWKTHWLEYGQNNRPSYAPGGRQIVDRNAGTLNNPDDYAGITIWPPRPEDLRD